MVRVRCLRRMGAVLDCAQTVPWALVVGSAMAANTAIVARSQVDSKQAPWLLQGGETHFVACIMVACIWWLGL